MSGERRVPGSNWRRAELECVGELLLGDALARCQRAGDDALADLGGDLPGRRQRGIGQAPEQPDLHASLAAGEGPGIGLTGVMGGFGRR
jgi:hypothetical protein